MKEKLLRPDSKGRITLGKEYVEGVSSFRVTETADNKIILEPQVEIPAREMWLFENKEALSKVKKGLQDSKEGKLSSKGSFSQFADDEID